MRILLAFIFLFGCGQDRVVTEYVPVPPPSDGRPPSGGGGGGGGGGAPSYQETQALLNNYCLSCHSTAQFMGSERALRSSAVAGRLRSGSMPPSNAGKKLPDAERKKILTFF